MTQTSKTRRLIENITRWSMMPVSRLFSYEASYKLRLAVSVCYTQWIAPSLKQAGRSLLLMRPILLRGSQYISIGSFTTIGRHASVTAWHLIDGLTPQLSIGSGCDLGEYIHISCANKITIGNGVLAGRWVTIVDNAHGLADGCDLVLPPQERAISSKGPVEIGDNVWIGDKSTILPNVKIGQGVVIAANSVVTTSIPDYAMAAGSPARVVRIINQQGQLQP